MSWEAWGAPDDPQCEVCGGTPSKCVCPECPICGDIGNPACYEAHGLERTEEQIDSAIRHDPNDGPWLGEDY